MSLERKESFFSFINHEVTVPIVESTAKGRIRMKEAKIGNGFSDTTFKQRSTVTITDAAYFIKMMMMKMRCLPVMRVV